jgi:hypothetical protein
MANFSTVEVSAEIKKVIEELLRVFGLPEDCVMVTSPDGTIRIDNEKKDHILEILTRKGTPPEFLGANSYQGNG